MARPETCIFFARLDKTPFGPTYIVNTTNCLGKCFTACGQKLVKLEKLGNGGSYD